LLWHKMVFRDTHTIFLAPRYWQYAVINALVI
jgi:hypothetical protein